MSLVNRAIWFIESHYAEDMTLDRIADVVGVSRYHLVRAFGCATGYSVMRYLRVRRLSIAAQSLATDDTLNILDVALEAGYSSHEAFTRAFRGQFGITPEAIRNQRDLANIEIVEPIIMNNQPQESIEPSRIETRKTFLVAGLRERYGEEASRLIPAQWQRFTPYIGAIPQQVNGNTYGVGYNGDDEGNIDYICGVEVSTTSDLPTELDYVRVPEQLYVIFTHRDHVSTIGRTWDIVWGQWLPQSEYKAADAPFFECYGASFDPVSGMGGIELWIPVNSRTPQK